MEAPGLTVPAREGDLLWTPGPDRAERANVTAFTRWLARERNRDFGDEFAEYARTQNDYRLR